MKLNGWQSWSHSILITVFMALIPSVAIANTFGNRDIQPLNDARSSALALTEDIIQVALSLRPSQPTVSDLLQLHCLDDLESALNDIFLRIDAASNLVHLSATMDASSDEIQINRFLVAAVPYDLDLNLGDRKRIINVQASCSSSALVNSYAQKAVAAVDKANAAFASIAERLRPAVP